jgi:predicted CXXCH cytochrome family protein
VRRLALLLAGGAVWLLLAAVPVFADNGPHHQGASATTDGCSGCHRAHTAQAQHLLVNPSQTSLCYTCHGTNGLGATTDVQDGVQYNPVTLTQQVTAVRGTTIAGGLRGGGFDNAVINSAPATNADPIGVLGAPVPTTSRHDVGGPAGTAWGNGAINSGAGTGVALNCGSCHDPHGNGSYRILQPTPEGLGGPVAIADVANNTYAYRTTDYWQPGDPNATQYFDNVTAWCATCHTRYNAPAGSGHTTSGDAIFTFRHATTVNLNTPCIKCHVSHGSNATMGTNSQAVPWPGTSTPRGFDSSLLRINNRGVCEKCHTK